MTLRFWRRPETDEKAKQRERWLLEQREKELRLLRLEMQVVTRRPEPR